jgi:hypothetical protein
MSDTRQQCKRRPVGRHQEQRRDTAGTGRTRLELLGNDLKEEKLRAVHLLLLSQVVAFCLMVGTILAGRLAGRRVLGQPAASCLGGFTVISSLAAVLPTRLCDVAMRTRSNRFAASIAELGRRPSPTERRCRQ